MPREDEDDTDDRPAPKRRRDDDEYEDDDRPRRRRRRDEDDDYDARRTDATGGLIPYKNGKALAAYYCGVFALIPCAGAVLGPLALIFGFLGLSYAKKHPEARGKGHAIAGIVLGIICSLGNIVAPIVLLVISWLNNR